MKSLFRRDPVKKLVSEYRDLLKQARDLQRNGDIQGFAATMERAERLALQIDEARRSR